MLMRMTTVYGPLAIAVIVVGLPCIGNNIGCSKCPTASAKSENQLEYVTPEDVGYSSEKLDEVKQRAEESGYAAIMALHDGKVFLSWGEIAKNYKCHSIRKPFLGALYGIHVEQGNIDLDATLEELNIDDIPPGLTPEEKQATVRDLLKSRSGVYHEAAAEAPIMAETRPKRGSHEPDTFFYYNNWDFNALGTIFEQETGTKIFEEFKRRIADPVGMEDFSTENCYYQLEKEKSMHQAYSFRMSARDMARFGVLYQKNGMWKDTRIISSEWIAESTTSYSIYESTYGLGYGYMWKVCPEGSALAEMIGQPGYFHTGIGVHAVVVLPKMKLVIVERLDTDGEWVDPGEVGLELCKMIVDARISD